MTAIIEGAAIQLVARFDVRRELTYESTAPTTIAAGTPRKTTVKNVNVSLAVKLEFVFGMRIGRELARVRSGEEQPTPTDFRRAVRDVIQHCIYGVDHNPLAVDLCKLALPVWLTVGLLPFIYLLGLGIAYEMSCLRIELSHLGEAGLCQMLTPLHQKEGVSKLDEVEALLRLEWVLEEERNDPFEEMFSVAHAVCHSVAVVLSNHAAAEVGLQCVQDLDIALVLHDGEFR